METARRRVLLMATAALIGLTAAMQYRFGTWYQTDVLFAEGVLVCKGDKRDKLSSDLASSS